jgi:hypothetical protein
MDSIELPLLGRAPIAPTVVLALKLGRARVAATTESVMPKLAINVILRAIETLLLKSDELLSSGLISASG